MINCGRMNERVEAALGRVLPTRGNSVTLMIVLAL